jgi:surfeit locus 1 family protein
LPGGAVLSTLRAKRLLWPAAATAIAVALLISLGNWQMRRLAWKEGLISAIEQRTHLDPVSLAEARERAAKGEGIEYLRVKVSGRFANDKELHLYAFDEQSGPGYQIFTPLRLGDGSVVIINRGYIPESLVDPASRRAGALVGEVTVTGLVRGPEEASLFSPANDPAKNIWFTRDLNAMAAAALGPGAQVAPFFIDAEAEPAVPGGWPKGGTTRLTLPNRHLEYALTWYGLAAALIGVFAAFAASRWLSPP